MVDDKFGEAFRAQLLSLFVWRRDVRRFSRNSLPEKLLERLAGIACLAPSVGLSEPWRFVEVKSTPRREAIRKCFEQCNAAALESQSNEKSALYARLKLAGLDDAAVSVCCLRRSGHNAQGHGLGRFTMPETVDFSAVMAIHTFWLAARAEGYWPGLGFNS